MPFGNTSEINEIIVVSDVAGSSCQTIGFSVPSL